MPTLSVTRAITISAVLGLCGVLYELVFAQSLSILFGQSAVQYSLTIGLFLGGMGFGAYVSETWSQPLAKLKAVQFALAVCAPFLFVALWWLGVSGGGFATKILGYGSCLAIGALTGAELPLILRTGASRTSWILGADYFGMLLACLAFPLILLPNFGVFATLIGAAALNGFVFALIVDENRRAAFVVPVLLLATLMFEPGLREWLSQSLIEG